MIDISDVCAVISTVCALYLVAVDIFDRRNNRDKP